MVVLTQLRNYAPLRQATPPTERVKSAFIQTPKISNEVSPYLKTIEQRTTVLLSSPIQAYIPKLAKVAELSFAERDIMMETQTQLRASNKVRKGGQGGDRSVLSRARVLTLGQATAMVAEQVTAAGLKKRRGRPPKARAIQEDLTVE